MPKRGRPSGATSWWRNPENIAAHHANVLLELWLAGAPVLEIRVMLSSLASSPELQTMIEDCWRERGNEHRYTVPARIKRKLCQLAVAHVVELRRDAILRRAARKARARLRMGGSSDAEITAILSRTPPACSAKDFEAPDVKKVLELVNRRAPRVTLRRKKADRRILRK